MSTLDIERLNQLIKAREVDTVIVAAVDVQGKLFGKRMPADHFVNIAKNGIHACAVNLVWDILLTPPPNMPNENFAFCKSPGWLGDMRMVPNLSTMRYYPWCEKTVLVLADCLDGDGNPVEVAPRNMLKKQLEKAGEMGFQVQAASEYEFYVFRETHDSIRDKGYAALTPLTSGTLRITEVTKAPAQ